MYKMSTTLIFIINLIYYSDLILNIKGVDILYVKGVDILLVGQTDLQVSLSHQLVGQTDLQVSLSHQQSKMATFCLHM